MPFHTRLPRSMPYLFVPALLLGGLAPAAAQTTGSTATAAAQRDAQYEQDAAYCHQNSQSVDLQACLREAATMQAERRRNAASPAAPAADNDNPDVYMRNALRRCQWQPASERAACEALIRNQGDVAVQGSVLEGGQMRMIAIPQAPQMPTDPQQATPDGTAPYPVETDREPYARPLPR
ncbi:MAG: hypothetical protein ABN482_10105 [Corticimicrobacter sp.]|uniref:hypothetical protein n=1 Tax=Corticimicrobacter sp. TaxID=2678536 RepID=UPI0032DA4302